MAAQADEEDVCSLCLDPFTDPRYLPCGNFHVFCRPCLQTLVEHSRQQGSLPCPQCRSNVKIPVGGATAFEQVLADRGPHASRSGRTWPSTARRSGPATPLPVVRPLSARRLGPVPLVPPVPSALLPSAHRAVSPRANLPGHVDDAEWESEVRAQQRLWRANMRRQEESAVREIRRLTEETARPFSHNAGGGSQQSQTRPEISRPQEPRREGGQLGVILRQGEREAEIQQERLDRMMRAQEVRAEQEQKRLNRIVRKQEERQELDQRRLERMMKKREREAEKEQRMLERRAEKEERRQELQTRKQERREQKEQTKLALRLEKEWRRQLHA